MHLLARTTALLLALAAASASLADETLYPPWDGGDTWREGEAFVGWDYGSETWTYNDATVDVDLVAVVVGVSWANQHAWNYETWTAPADDYYRFTFNYNASGSVTMAGSSFWGDASWCTMRVILRIIPPEYTYEDGPYWYNYWRCVASTSGIPYLPPSAYEYDEDVHVTTPPIWFDEGDTATIAGGIQIQPFCLSVLGFVSAIGENFGVLESVQIVQENPPDPILAVDPDPPSHNFGQQTRLEPAEWTFNIWNSGTGTLDWGAESDRDWISVSPNSGSSTGEWDAVTVTIDNTILPLGSHSGHVYIDSTSGSDIGFISIEIINVPPGADAGGPYSGTAGENIVFDGSGSVDLDGTITSYRWDWDDNGTWDTSWSGSPTATHSFPASGSYTVGLQVLDNDGDTGTDTCACNIDLLSTVVYPDGSGQYATIQEAIDAASEGAVIYLADGVFRGTGNRDIDYGGKAITVRSQSDNPEACIIDCQGSEGDPHRGFYFHTEEGPDSILRGVMITNGYVDGRGGGVKCSDTAGPRGPEFWNCIFDNNCASGGGGMYRSGVGSVDLHECIFRYNVSSFGGGLYCGNAVHVYDCEFLYNSADAAWGGGICVEGNYAYLHLVNCTLRGNSAYGGGGVYIRGQTDVSFTGCEFSGNTAGWFGGGGFAYWGPSNGGYYNGVTLTDCVFSDNVSEGFRGGAIQLIDEPSATISNCTLIGNSAHSDSESAGGCLYLSEMTTAVISNTVIALSSTSEAIHCSDGSTATLNCCDIYGNEGGDWVGCIEDQYSINGNICEDPLFCDPENGDYHIMDTSPCAPAQSGCGLIGTLDVGCTQQQFTVPGTHSTIQAAIDDASDHAIITLTSSAYLGPGNRDIDFLGKAITVCSQTGNPEDCIINCMGSTRGFNFISGEGANSVLEGVTITGGSADIGGGIFCTYASPTIRTCVIEGNDASSEGAGLYCDHAAPELVNCVISGNDATMRGGAMMCYNTDPGPTFTNCTVADNWAGTEGPGLFLAMSVPTLTGCILWDDAPITLLYSDDPYVTYCDVQGGWAGVGNIDVSPRFTDAGSGDYRLLVGSPCIDASDNLAVPAEITTDLDGNPRFHDDPGMDDTGNGDPPIVDMGAYEFQGESPACPGDLNGDGQRDQSDLGILLASYNIDAGGDIDGDGDTDQADLGILLAVYDIPCP
ncbi:MAG: right-handed parallel beta-helix repeat-containing protein [Phycisphaerales bacterium]|nr:right-handed parallel beta-helix repeat-containing protein [Phycisphaerales bacterium]